MHPLVANPLFVTVKAALAAGLATALCRLLDIPDLLSAAFVALLSVSPTLTTGLRRGGEQLVGALGAGLWAALCTMLPLPTPLTVVLALLGSVGGAFVLRLGRVYAVAGFSALYVVLIPGHAALVTVEIRLAAVALGALAALLVNAVVTAPFYRNVFSRRVGQLEELTRQALAAADHKALFNVDAALFHLEGELEDALGEARWHPGVPIPFLQETRARVDALRAQVVHARSGATVTPPPPPEHSTATPR